jgi:hypothetical protein
MTKKKGEKSMFAILTFVLLIAGLWTKNETLISASGFYAVATAISVLASKFTIKPNADKKTEL